VLCFPRRRLNEAHGVVLEGLPSRTADHIYDEDDSQEPIAFKYYGNCSSTSRFQAEVQIVPMLIGLFWQIEHSTIDKPSPQLKAIAQSLEMRQRKGDVLQALRSFEDEFEEFAAGGSARRRLIWLPSRR